MCAKRKAADKKKILFSDEFYSDMSEKDMLHAVLIRSPFAYGTISSIDFAPKTKIPEGYVLFTHADLPLKKTIRVFNQEIPIFCSSDIAFKGECVGLLVGEDEKILADLKKRVQIRLNKTELKRSENEFSASYRKSAVSVFDGTPITEAVASLRSTLAELSKPKEIIAKRKVTLGSVDEILDSEEPDCFIIEGNWKNHIRTPSYQETDGVLCFVKGGNLHIFTPTLWIPHLRKTISEVTGFPSDKIIITRTRISVANTNVLFLNAITVAQAAIAAIQTGKPVMLTLSRKSQEQIIESPPAVTISHRTAVDKTGIIRAMDIAIEFDAGSYNPFAQEIIDRLVIASCGMYACKNIRIVAKAYKTHNPPSALNLSMLDAQAFFAVENQMQRISEKTGIAPLELRLLNKSSLAQKNTMPFQFDFGRAGDALSALATKSDFNRKYAVYRLSERGRYEVTSNSPYSPPLKGIGLACGFEGSGYLGEHFEKALISLQVTLSEDKKVIVASQPPAPTIRDIWTKIIMDTLEIDKRSIIFVHSPLDESAKKETLAFPEHLVGDVSIKTVLLKKCLDALKRKKNDALPVSVKKTLPTSRKKQWNQAEFTGSPYYNTSFGACTVELELDTCTYREKVLRICVIIDGGKILNAKAAETVVLHAVQQSLSSLIDDDTVKCPNISVQFMQSEAEPKQIGHIIHSILPAAFTSALSQALAAPVNELPLQTDSLYKLREAYEISRHNETEDER